MRNSICQCRYLFAFTAIIALAVFSTSRHDQLAGETRLGSSSAYARPPDTIKFGAGSFARFDPRTQNKIKEVYGRLPLGFETDPASSGFIARGHGYKLSLSANRIRLAVAAPEPRSRRDLILHEPDAPEKTELAELSMEFIGGDRQARMEGLDALPGERNYLIGRDPAKWRKGVRSYSKVRANDLYSGVDLVVYGAQSRPEFDLVVKPGVDPRVIKLGYAGIRRMSVEPDGDLVLLTSAGEVRQSRPVVYQMVNGTRREVSGSYIKFGEEQIGFQIGEYDQSLPLVIDPVISYSTLLGGSGGDSILFMTADREGNVYLTGDTSSFDFPIVNAAQPTRRETPQSVCTNGCADIFVTKINAAGTALIYSTFLGGSDGEVGFGLAVGDDGSAYVTGWTESPDFPVTPGAVRASFPDRRDAYAAKLSPSGSQLVYSTLLGGHRSERGYGIAVDGAGNAYVTGRTESNDFPTARPFQAASGPALDVNGFVTKLNPTGTELIYSTLLGGSDVDVCNAIAVDRDGNAYVTGSTLSYDFPVTPGAYQEEYGESDDVFVAKFNAEGSALVYSTYIGGEGGDIGFSLAIDSAGAAYVAGFSGSFDGEFDFPLVNPVQRGSVYYPNFGVAINAIVFKLDPTGSRLLYSTYLGGSEYEDINGAIAVDSAGRIYVSGASYSTDFPVTPDALQPKFALGLSDGFMAVLDPSRGGGESLVYSSYLGGSMHDYAQSAAIDGQGAFYAAGVTRTTPPGALNDFPTANALQSSVSGTGDAFLTKLSLTGRIASDTIAPLVRIQTPIAEGSLMTSDPTVALSGAADDNTGVTEVYWRNDRWATDLVSDSAIERADGTSAWTIKDVVLQRGPNRLTVTARDAAGNAASASVTINYQPKYLIETIAGNGRVRRRFVDEGQLAPLATLGLTSGMTLDAAGNLYFSDYFQLAVRKVSTDGIITTVAGNGDPGIAGDGGPAVQANLNSPHGLAFDNSGNLYIVDTNVHRVRKVSPDGRISTFAGSGPFVSTGGFEGDGGPATSARLNNPLSVAADRAGNVYIADTINHRIRKVDGGGVITTIAGIGEEGSSGDGGPATAAKIGMPSHLFFDGAGNLIFLSQGGVRRIDRSGIISTVNTAAQLPGDLAMDAVGNLYFVNRESKLLRLNADGTTEVLAGLSGDGSTGDGGAATAARLSRPIGIAVDRLGRIYFGEVVDVDVGSRIRRLSPSSASDTGAPTIRITSPSTSFPSSQAPFITVSGVAADEQGVFQVRWSNDRGGAGVAVGTNRWIVQRLPLQDGLNHITITAVDASGNAASAQLDVGFNRDTTPPMITIQSPTSKGSLTTTNGTITLAGAANDANGIVEVRWENDRGLRGWAEGTNSWKIQDVLLREGLNQFTVTARDGAGNVGSASLSVLYNPDFIISTVAGGGYFRSTEFGDGKAAVGTRLGFPHLVAVDNQGNVYFSERDSHRLRKISRDGVLSTVAGTGEPGYSGDGGPATQAQIWTPSAVVVDQSGNIFMLTVHPSDFPQGYIRKIDPAGIITTHPVGQITADGLVHLLPMRGMAIDPAGNLYLVRVSKLYKITPNGQTSVVAGAGTCNINDPGDGVPASAASICNPMDIAIDGQGNIYLAETALQRVRRIGVNGIISVVAGNGQFAGYTEAPLDDGKRATEVALGAPTSVVVDGGGNLFIVESTSSRVRKVTPGGVITTVAGRRTPGPAQGGFRGDGGAATWGELNIPIKAAIDSSGNLYIADLFNQRIRKLTRYTPDNRTVASASAASFDRASLAVESIVSAFGSNLAPAVKIADATPLPTTLAGATVKVRDSRGVERQAPLFFVSPNQINFQIPPGTSTGLTTITSTDANGNSASGVEMITNVAPGLFSANANGQGVAAAVVLRIRADGSQSYEPVAVFDQSQNRFVARPIDLGPATDQVFLILFGTGLRNHSALSNVNAKIGAEDAEVLFVGAQGGFVGLDQINLRLPRSLAGRGEVDVVLTADGKPANAVKVNFSR
ncbi:MAG: SBBP repeat-containing protein [Blastocatellales bacterium]